MTKLNMTSQLSATGGFRKPDDQKILLKKLRKRKRSFLAVPQTL